jgi:hypothetical protein
MAGAALRHGAAVVRRMPDRVARARCRHQIAAGDQDTFKMIRA